MRTAQVARRRIRSRGATGRQDILAASFFYERGSDLVDSHSNGEGKVDRLEVLLPAADLVGLSDADLEEVLCPVRLAPSSARIAPFEKGLRNATSAASS